MAESHMDRERRGPVFIVNGRISDGTLSRYRRFSFFLRGLSPSVDSSLPSRKRRRKGSSPRHAREKVVATGNLKYYREAKDLPARAPQRGHGHLRQHTGKELPILIPVIEGAQGGVPRGSHLRRRQGIDPDRSHSKTASRRIRGRPLFDRERGRARGGRQVVLVDTVGDLVALYARSLVAFVGGSLAPYGGQNLLEPLFVGTPVIFGPHVENFREIADEVIAHGAGFMVEDGASLGKIRLVLQDADAREALVEAGRHVLKGKETSWKRLPASCWRPSEKTNSSGDNMEEFTRLVSLMETLRGERGCPWDRKQTEQAFKTFLLEEVYQLIEAIQHEDYDAMKEELGDLLFHIVFICPDLQGKAKVRHRGRAPCRIREMYGDIPCVLSGRRRNTGRKRWEEIKRTEKADYSPASHVPSIPPPCCAPT